MNRNIDEMDPDAHLRDDEDEQQIEPTLNNQSNTFHEHHNDDLVLDAITHETQQEFPDKNKNVYDEFATTDDVITQRGNGTKKTIAIIVVGMFSLLTLSYFTRAVSEVEQDQIRKVSEQAKLPQDLNMTENSVLWQTAQASQLEAVQRELNMLKAGGGNGMYAGELNASHLAAQAQQPIQAPIIQQPQVNINELVAAAVRKQLGGRETNLRPLPPLPSNNLPKNMQKLAKRDGNKSTLSVDDFLTVPSNIQSLVPQTVVAAQNNGNQFLPPSLTQGTPPPSSSTISIPPLGSNVYKISGIQAKIIDAPGLKTGYGDSISVAASKNDKKPYYLMTGFAKAALYTGFRAPTLEVGEKNTQPVYMSVDSSVISANDTNLDIEECTVLGTSRGNLNSERAEIRLDELNCAIRYKNGKRGRITEKINGWVYGEDGIFGLKGRLISGEGKILKAALPISLIQSLIGALSSAGGMAQAIVPGATTIGATASTISGTDLLEKSAINGFGQGTNKALGQVVSYYMGMLKELNPSIEILAGRNNLTILFKGGEELKEKDFEPINISKLAEGKK